MESLLSTRDNKTRTLLQILTMLFRDKDEFCTKKKCHIKSYILDIITKYISRMSDNKERILKRE